MVPLAPINHLTSVGFFVQIQRRRHHTTTTVCVFLAHFSITGKCYSFLSVCLPVRIRRLGNRDVGLNGEKSLALGDEVKIKDVQGLHNSPHHNPQTILLLRSAPKG